MPFHWDSAPVSVESIHGQITEGFRYEAWFNDEVDPDRVIDQVRYLL